MSTGRVSGISIKIGIGDREGVQAVREFALGLERFGTTISDFRFVFPRVITLLEKAFAKQFASKGSGPVVGPWPGLTEKYAKWKQAHFPGKPILEREGTMKAALTQKSGPHALRDYSASQLNYGTVFVPYASFHQTGTHYMKARPPADFGPQFQSGLKNAMQRGLVDAARAADSSGEIEKALGTSARGRTSFDTSNNFYSGSE